MEEEEEILLRDEVENSERQPSRHENNRQNAESQHETISLPISEWEEMKT